MLILVFGMVVLPTTVETVTRGRSLGKLAVGARIVRDDGGAIGFRHAFIRALDGRARDLHDRRRHRRARRAAERPLEAARRPARRHLQPARARPRADPLPLYLSPLLAGWAATADVARLPDRLSRRIAQFVRQAPHLTAAARVGLSGELAAEASAYVSPLPPVDPESFLVGVAVLRRRRDAAALALEKARLDELAPVLDALPHRFPDRAARG